MEISSTTMTPPVPPAGARSALVSDVLKGEDSDYATWMTARVKAGQSMATAELERLERRAPQLTDAQVRVVGEAVDRLVQCLLIDPLHRGLDQPHYATTIQRQVRALFDEPAPRCVPHNRTD